MERLRSKIDSPSKIIWQAIYILKTIGLIYETKNINPFRRFHVFKKSSRNDPW